ncbi:MAG: hypothetical protein WCX27_02170 [Candidatus Paceibacterota bacterium]|jgi:hypothetical protein
MTFDIRTGNINLMALGDNAFIVRGGKKIKIPSVKEGIKGSPTLEDGDNLLCGPKSMIRVASDFNKGKENPIDDWKQNSSKTVNMGPNSELAVSGFESWDKTDKDKKRHYGSLIKNIELKKGLFSVSYSNTDDILKTPIADVKFLGTGGNTGTFDVYDDILYSNAGGEKGVEYTNKRTKVTFLAKSSIPFEVIVTKDGIYKKGMLKMDDIFSSMNTLGLTSYFSGLLYESVPEMDPAKLAESYKSIPKGMEQALGAFDMFSQMTPEDLERMMKMNEAHGAKITPEMKEQFKELPDMMKKMKKEGYMEQMKKATAMSKGMIEGLGDAGIDRLTKATSKGMKQAKETQGQMSKIYTGEGKQVDASSIFESKRAYKPLTDAKKVA